MWKDSYYPHFTSDRSAHFLVTRQNCRGCGWIDLAFHSGSIHSLPCNSGCREEHLPSSRTSSETEGAHLSLAEPWSSRGGPAPRCPLHSSASHGPPQVGSPQGFVGFIHAHTVLVMLHGRCLPLTYCHVGVWHEERKTLTCAKM